jgi:hypothetical protein
VVHLGELEPVVAGVVVVVDRVVDPVGTVESVGAVLGVDVGGNEDVDTDGTDDMLDGFDVVVMCGHVSLPSRVMAPPIDRPTTATTAHPARSSVGPVNGSVGGADPSGVVTGGIVDDGGSEDRVRVVVVVSPPSGKVPGVDVNVDGVPDVGGELSGGEPTEVVVVAGGTPVDKVPGFFSNLTPNLRFHVCH